jgi:hypothetical protein
MQLELFMRRLLIPFEQPPDAAPQHGRASFGLTPENWPQSARKPTAVQQKPEPATTRSGRTQPLMSLSRTPVDLNFTESVGYLSYKPGLIVASVAYSTPVSTPVVTIVVDQWKTETCYRAALGAN